VIGVRPTSTGCAGATLAIQLRRAGCRARHQRAWERPISTHATPSQRGRVRWRRMPVGDRKESSRDLGVGVRRQSARQGFSGPQICGIGGMRGEERWREWRRPDDPHPPFTVPSGWRPSRSAPLTRRSPNRPAQGGPDLVVIGAGGASGLAGGVPHGSAPDAGQCMAACRFRKEAASRDSHAFRELPAFRGDR